MTTHTPGPWKSHLGRGASPRFHVQTTAGYQIASTTALSGHTAAAEEDAEREANARLIAAAPDLLGVLRDVAALLPTAQRMHPDDVYSLQSRVVAAITKAEGRA